MRALASYRASLCIGFFAIGAMLLTGCDNGSKNRTNTTPTPTVVQEAKKPEQCLPDDKAAAFLPSTVTKTCVWRTDGTLVGQAGSTVVIERSGEDNGAATRRFHGYNANTGDLVWQSERVRFGSTTGEEKTYEAGIPDRATRILYDGKTAYVAAFSSTVRPADSLNEETSRLTIRFYNAHATGKIISKRYMAPAGYYMDDDNDAYGDAQLLLKREREDSGYDYLVVNPVTGKGKEFQFDSPIAEAVSGIAGLAFDSEQGWWATPEGDIVSRFSMIGTLQTPGGHGYAIRHPDGGIGWATHTTTPPGADPVSAELSGIYGGYAAIWWRIGEFTGNYDTYSKRPILVALHDLQTGEVIASTQIEADGNTSAQKIVASPDGRYLASGDVVFDLRRRTHHATIPQLLYLDLITPAGIGYGSGTENHVYAYDIKTNKLRWDKPDVEGTLPHASSTKNLIFAISGQEQIVVAYPLK